MTLDDNAALVESAFDAWNRGDVAAFAEHMAEDVVWVEIGGRPEGDDGERHGRERLRERLEDLFDAWESYHLEVERLAASGDRVLVLARETARGRSSGVEVAGRWGYLVTVADGRMTRIEAYRDPDAALRLWES